MNRFVRRFPAELGWAAVTFVLLAWKSIWVLTDEGGSWDQSTPASLFFTAAMIAIPVAGAVMRPPPGYWARARQFLAVVYGPIFVDRVGVGASGGGWLPMLTWMATTAVALVGLACWTAWWLLTRRRRTPMAGEASCWTCQTAGGSVER